MIRATVVLLLVTLAVPAAAGDLIVTERPSPGLNPWMKAAYVNLYTDDLGFVSILRWNSLAEAGTPPAALMVGDSLFIAETNCNSERCAPRVVRSVRNGGETLFASLATFPRALRLTPRGELLVATEDALIRFDRGTGAALGSIPIPRPADAWVSDADVDRSGCGVAVALAPGHIARGTLCAADPGWRIVALPGAVPPNSIRGVRFLPDGSLLAAGMTIYRVGADGALLRTWNAGDAGGCALELADSPREVILGCGWSLQRLDLESGAIVQRSGLAYGIGVNSITAAVPEPAPPPARRRTARR